MVGPLISVVVPTYNHSNYIQNAIQSVLDQTYSNIELIIVNDGSTDKTSEILTTFENNLTIQIIHQKNLGLSTARNTGIKRAQGDYIALLDADDLMEPNRLELQYTEMQANPTIEVLYTSVLLINENQVPIKTLRREKIDPTDFLTIEFFRNQIPSPSTIMARRSAFEKEIFASNYTLSEDLEWTIRAAHSLTFSYLDIPLTKYRRHSGNISEDLTKLRKVEEQILSNYNTQHIQECVKKSSLNNKSLWMGKILYIKGAFKDAITIFENLNDPLAFFYMGNCYFELKEYEQAIHSYKLSINEDQSNPAAQNNLGVSLTKIGKNGKKCFEIAKRLKPDYQDPDQQRFTRRELRRDLLPYQSY